MTEVGIYINLWLPITPLLYYIQDKVTKLRVNYFL